VAVNLSHQGRYAAAEPLYEHALAIARQRLGAEHPTTAVHCANLAANRVDQHKFASAQPLLREALTIRRKVLGEEHVLTAASTSALARNFQAQADYTAADPLYRKALAIDKKQLGEEHHATAADLHNLAANLNDQEKYADAEPLFRRSLALLRKSLGDDHPETAIGGSDLAANLHAQGKYAEAETVWTAAADGFARARLRVAGSGLERAAITGERSPLPALAAVLARNRKPRPAWQRFEESLARGTWDDLSARLRRTPDERDRQTALAQGLQRLDQLIERNLADPDTPEQKQARETLLGQRRKMQEELDDLRGQLEKKYGPVAAQVFDGATIQKALPPDAALVGWIDRPGKSAMADPNGEHWAVLLRARGEPAWERLRGSGPGGAWTQADTDLPAHLRRALQTARSDWQGLSRKLSEQRLQPLARHLAAHDGLPAARRLIILPAPAVAGVPVETLAPDFTISYAPSATLFAYLRQQPKRAGAGLLALADPVFDRPRDRIAPLPLPPGGLLLTVVVPGSSADGARLKAGDVLLRYAGTELKAAADLPPLIAAQAQNKEVGVTLWREGRTVERTVPGGKLGVVVASDPAPQALAERRKVDDLLARSRGAGEGPWPPLPGTRVEAEGLRRVCVSARTPFKLLADSDASEQALFDMVRSRELAQYRYLHLATHGTLDDRFPLSSAVILARDHLPDPLAQLLANEPVYDGRLTAEKVLRDWSLQTDLVTLSACQTALGKYERGEGFVGFSQALLIAGSRSVCLSLWKVDDAATALLMDRFYQNLLGQRDGLKAPLPKAQALAEAKEWLRTLSRDEALKQAAQLTQGVERGKGRPVQPLLPEVPAAADKGDRPYAHPYYWAAFVLIGDPD